MNSITLENVGKKFGSQWIFRNQNFQFQSGKSYSITGPNGSGKSTLLKIISTLLTPDEGIVKIINNGVHTKDRTQTALMFSVVTPYTEPIEDFTFRELLEFQECFKPFHTSYSIKDIIQISGLENSADKFYKDFSSGMKQRVKLCLALFSQSPFILLDEPTSNLDKKGIDWYAELIKTIVVRGRIYIVFSNRTQEETFFCEPAIHLTSK